MSGYKKVETSTKVSQKAEEPVLVKLPLSRYRIPVNMLGEPTGSVMQEFNKLLDDAKTLGIETRMDKENGLLVIPFNEGIFELDAIMAYLKRIHSVIRSPDVQNHFVEVLNPSEEYPKYLTIFASENIMRLELIQNSLNTRSTFIMQLMHDPIVMDSRKFEEEEGTNDEH